LAISSLCLHVTFKENLFKKKVIEPVMDEMQGRKILNLIKENEVDNDLKKQIGMVFNIEALIKSEGKYLVRTNSVRVRSKQSHTRPANVSVQDDFRTTNRSNQFKSIDMVADRAKSFKRKNTVSLEVLSPKPN
jgi:hypothetical protein